MSLDAQNLVMLIKQAAVDAVNAKDPMSFKIGVVSSVSPLKISLNQKITISASQLLLTNAVREYTVYATVNHTTDAGLSGVNITTSDSTESTEPISLEHSHTYTGCKKYTIHQGLKTGEKVLMLRCDGGQKFIVLDRLEAPNG